MNISNINRGTNVTIITMRGHRIDSKVTDVLIRLNCLVLNDEVVINGNNIKMMLNKRGA